MRSRSWPSSTPPTPASGRRRSAATSVPSRPRRRRASRIASARSRAGPVTSGRSPRCGADRSTRCSTRFGRAWRRCRRTIHPAPGCARRCSTRSCSRYLAGRPRRDLDALLAEPASPSRAPVGPPTTLRTEELLGEALLKAGRPREAIAAYERALQLTPNRSAALLGLARARHAAGDASGAAEAYAQAPRQLARRRSGRAGARGSAQPRRREVTRPQSTPVTLRRHLHELLSTSRAPSRRWRGSWACAATTSKRTCSTCCDPPPRAATGSRSCPPAARRAASSSARIVSPSRAAVRPARRAASRKR